MHHIPCSFLAKHQFKSDLDPLQPRFGALRLLAFPKTKITFENKEISDHLWDAEKYYGAADGDWENCVRSQGAYFEGDWGVIVLGTMFLLSSIFFGKCLYFYITLLDTFWTDLVCTYTHTWNLWCHSFGTNIDSFQDLESLFWSGCLCFLDPHPDCNLKGDIVSSLHINFIFFLSH